MSEPGPPAACAALDDDLSAWLDGELAAERAAAVHAHLAGCRRCAAQLDALRAVDAGLRALAKASPGVAEAERLARLRARVAEGVATGTAPDRLERSSAATAPPARSGQPAPAPRRRRPAVWMGAAAAGLLAALVVPRLVERVVLPDALPQVEPSRELAAPPAGPPAPAVAPLAERRAARAPEAGLADAPAGAAVAQPAHGGGFGASVAVDSAADPDAAAARAQGPEAEGGLDATDLEVVVRLDALLREPSLSRAERAALRAPLGAAERARLPEHLARWRALSPEQQAAARAAWARVRAAADPGDAARTR